MSDPNLINTYSPAAQKDEDGRARGSRELGEADPPPSLLRDEPGLRAGRGACGPGASVRGPPGGGGDPGVPLRGPADPVHPRPRTQDLLLRDALRDGHRRGRMLQV